jgi:hypothetical protein
MARNPLLETNLFGMHATYNTPATNCWQERKETLDSCRRSNIICMIMHTRKSKILSPLNFFVPSTFDPLLRGGYTFSPPTIGCNLD